MELNPRRGRKDEGRAGHGMGEDDGHAGREEQEGTAMERERGAGRPRQAVRRGLAGRAAREGAGAARRPAQGGGGAARRPKQRGGGGGSRRARPWRERGAGGRSEEEEGKGQNCFFI